MEISWQILTHEITCAWNGKFCIPQLFPIRGQWKKLITKIKIKGPENPTRQLLPIMSTKCCSGDGERRKDKGCGGGPPSKTKLGATKLYVKDGVSKMVGDKVVCERWCATPTTRNEGGRHQVPRLPRKVPRRHRRLKSAQARHQSEPSAISAMPAMTKCHPCHAKCRGVTGD